MRFRSLAIRKLCAVAVGGAVGIVHGVQRLRGMVARRTAAGGRGDLGRWRCGRSAHGGPGFQFAREDFRSLFGFGINVVAGDVLNFLSRNMDNLLIGAVLGVTPLGFYAVGYRILDTSQQLLVNFARRLAFPVFSRLQGDLDRLQARLWAGYSRRRASSSCPATSAWRSSPRRRSS